MISFILKPAAFNLNTPPLMFIDIHAHAYRKPIPFVVQFCTAEQVIERYDQAGIERGVLLPIVSPEIYLPQANEDILEMAEQHPDRFIPWCNIDPRALTNAVDAPLDRLLRYYRDKGCKGVGEGSSRRRRSCKSRAST